METKFWARIGGNCGWRMHMDRREEIENSVIEEEDISICF